MPIPTLASATSVTITGSPIYSVTGTATIDTISGMLTNQRVTLYPAAAFVLGTGGNISATTATATIGKLIELLAIDGTIYELLPTAFYKPGGTDVAIADGGTGQSTAALGFDALSPLTTTGDMILYIAGSGNLRLPKGAANTVLKVDPTGTLPVWTAPSAWTEVAYNAADFTASTGNWTVDAGDVLSHAYKVIDNTMFFRFSIVGSDVSATPVTLRIAMPGGYTASTQSAIMMCRINDAGTGATVGKVAASGSLISISKMDSSAFTTTAADNTLAQGMVICEVV